MELLIPLEAALAQHSTNYDLMGADDARLQSSVRALPDATERAITIPLENSSLNFTIHLINWWADSEKLREAVEADLTPLRHDLGYGAREAHQAPKRVSALKTHASEKSQIISISRK